MDCGAIRGMGIKNHAKRNSCVILATWQDRGNAKCMDCLDIIIIQGLLVCFIGLRASKNLQQCLSGRNKQPIKTLRRGICRGIRHAGVEVGGGHGSI